MLGGFPPPPPPRPLTTTTPPNIIFLFPVTAPPVTYIPARFLAPIYPILTVNYPSTTARPISNHSTFPLPTNSAPPLPVLRLPPRLLRIRPAIPPPPRIVTIRHLRRRSRLSQPERQRGSDDQGSSGRGVARFGPRVEVRTGWMRVGQFSIIQA